MVLSAATARTCIDVCFALPDDGHAEAVDARITAAKTDRRKLAENFMRAERSNSIPDEGLTHPSVAANLYIPLTSRRCKGLMNEARIEIIM